MKPASHGGKGGTDNDQRARLISAVLLTTILTLLLLITLIVFAL